MTNFYFFSGKGGVGKTSMACMHAVRFADQGQKTLIVTTDPASNLADMFEQVIGHQIQPITTVPNLWGMEIDPDRASEEYVENVIAPLREGFPEEMIKVIEEQMSGPCTTEVAAFDRFTDFLASSNGDKLDFEAVIFDTAPTGHTLRLLELPAEWSVSIENALEGSGQTCIGPAAAVQDAKRKYEHAMAVMRDAERTAFIFVLHPEALAIKETERAVSEMGKLGIHTHRLIVNGIIPEQVSGNSLFGARAEMQSQYLEKIETELNLPVQRMPLLPIEIKGIDGLREIAGVFFDGATPASTDIVEQTSPINDDQALVQSAELHSLLEPNGSRRTIFFAGKGGVGKTVASCTSAVWLASQGHRTLLVTTDPAAHLSDVLGAPVGAEVSAVEGLSNLWAVNVDPRASAKIYKSRILDDARSRGRSPEAIQVMAEELEAPCTEEIAAFDKFIELASQGEWDVVVFDTAPTGHTMRLLELPIDWSKQIDVKVFGSVDSEWADEVAKRRFDDVIDMMRDSKRSTFAFVLYPESTPILEAHRAVEELRTVGIEPDLVVANYIIPRDQVDTPFVQARRSMQDKYMMEIDQRFSLPILQIPLLPYEIQGMEKLKDLGDRLFGIKEPMIQA